MDTESTAEHKAEQSEQQLPPGWNQPCLEEHLAEIATSIVKWREISPFLGLTEAKEQEILCAIPPLSVLEQKIAMLRLWKKKKGNAATYNQLCQAFRKSEKLDLQDKIQQILAESNGEAGVLYDTIVILLLTNLFSIILLAQFVLSILIINFYRYFGTSVMS